MDDECQDIFTVTKAGAGPLTHRQTRSRSFRVPSRGVRLRSSAATTPELAVDLALAGASPDAVVVGAWAARLWLLPVPAWLSGPDLAVDLARRPEQAHVRRRGTRGRRWDLPDDHVCLLDGRPVTVPSRTWLDCAALVPIGHVVAMGDMGLRRGLFTTDELARLLHWAFRRRGVGVARRAITLLDAASESPGESLMRVCLLDEGLPRPVCNVNVTVGGEWIARLDIAWPEAQVGVEYDGTIHLDERTRRRDARRRNLLLAHGWTIITATADDLRRPWVIADQVRRALRRAPLR